jgi:hypothetical protein
MPRRVSDAPIKGYSQLYLRYLTTDAVADALERVIDQIAHPPVDRSGMSHGLLLSIRDDLKEELDSRQLRIPSP